MKIIEYNLSAGPGQPKYRVCMSAFNSVYGISDYMRRKLSIQVKIGDYLSYPKKIFNDNSGVDEETIARVGKAWKNSKLDISDKFKVDISLPGSIGTGLVLLLSMIVHLI